MAVDSYPLSGNSQRTTFIFKSVGINGIITKAIQIEWIASEGVYNLGFGNYDETTGEIDDRAESKNGDKNKVLGTVVSALLRFWELKPDAIIFAKGSDAKRTREYQMGINRHLAEFAGEVHIWGEYNGEYEPFTPGKNYNSFLAKRRKP